MGYQITGSTKEKRWKILEVAVRQLGLQKVVYTIAKNVKLRKAKRMEKRNLGMPLESLLESRVPDPTCVKVLKDRWFAAY
ncbi:hypothetical protein CVD28_08905 [Bacillus sp. M6-12]|nr:hypothetical protein CVD28_08905 [Bacillus sp. M6-12]